MLILLFLFLRGASLLFSNLNELLFWGVMPTSVDVQLLNQYLRSPEQDPKWVQFVHESLRNCPQTELPRRFQSFMNIEMCTSTNKQIISLYQMIFYGREDPRSFIRPTDLECIVRVALEPYQFNGRDLSKILYSLCQDKHSSPFYELLKESYADHFSGFLEQKRQEELRMIERESLYRDFLQSQERGAWLKEENARLRQRLGLPSTSLELGLPTNS